jgi:hypothetical protein
MEPSSPPVAISFDCTPLRVAAGVAVPAEASPRFRALVGRMQAATSHHGTRNTYYLTNASCTFRFTNAAESGWIEFAIEGTVITDDRDTHTVGSDLTVALVKETCDWLTQPVVDWLALSARRAIEVEFDRYIAAGDLGRTLERLTSEQAVIDASGGYLGMNL